MSTVNIATFILDDDADLLQLIKDTIDEAGITNYQLFTSEEAFMSGLNEEIHVCVVDHKLTKKTGLDILKEVKAKNEGSYVIVYTGIKDPKVIVEYLNSDADKFVDKDNRNHLQQLTLFLQEGLVTAMKRIQFLDFLKAERNKI